MRLNILFFSHPPVYILCSTLLISDKALSFSNNKILLQASPYFVKGNMALGIPFFSETAYLEIFHLV